GTTCTATVSDASPGTASTPTGSVAFSSSGSGTFTPTSCTLSSETCSVTYTPSAVGTGTHTVTGSYGGDATHNTSSGTFALTVTNRSTSTAVRCTPASPARRSSDLGTTCTATVSDASPGTASTPTGSVAFSSSGSGTFTPTSCT